MTFMFKQRTIDEFILEPDYIKDIKLKNGECVIRRSFLIKKSHVGYIGHSLVISSNDIGRVFIIDEYKDRSKIDYILDKEMHPEQWYKYGGFKE